MASINPVRSFMAGQMTVAVYASRDDMGKAAAEDCANAAIRLLEQKQEVNILFPCAFSQIDFFKHFFARSDIDWSRMNAFVMDEYLGLEKGSPYLLANFAQERIFSQAPFKACYAMDGSAPDFQAECDRYAALLAAHPLDIACLGIGETGHLAYNEPDVADFNDPKLVKYVNIDEQSCHQAVHDGAFPNIESVPRFAMTVTIPVMTGAAYKQAVVPTQYKKEAVYRTVHDEISTQCPATVLRGHACVLYLDEDSARLL